MRHVLATCLALAIGGAARAEAPDASEEIWVVVHPKNPVQALDADQVFALFTRAQRYWPNQRPVVPFNAPAKSDLRERFDAWALKMSTAESGRFWIDRRIRGEGTAPRKAPLPRIAIGAVRRISGAIAYVPAGTCLRGVRVVAVVDQRGARAAPASVEEAPGCE